MSDALLYESTVIRLALERPEDARYALQHLEPRHFHRPLHRRAWELIGEAIDWDPLTPITLYAELVSESSPAGIQSWSREQVSELIIGAPGSDAWIVATAHMPSAVSLVQRSAASRLRQQVARESVAGASGLRISEIMGAVGVLETGSNGVAYYDLGGFDMRPVEWIVPGWLARGELAILCGNAGSGKSTMAARLAMAVADAQFDWCGLEPATRGTVIYVDQEQDKNECADIFLRLGAGSANGSLRVACQQHLDLGTNLPRLEREIATLNPVLVILDSMMMVMAVDGLSDMTKAVDAYRTLHRLRSTYGCSIVMLAHPRKTPTDTRGRRPKLTADDIWGLQAHQAQIGTAWLVQANPKDIGDHVVLEQAKRRRSPRLLAMRIGYQTEGEGKPITLTGHPHELAELAELSRARGQDTRNRVLEAVTQNPGASGLTIAQKLSMSPRTVQVHLTTLADSGAVKRFGSGRWSRFYAQDESKRNDGDAPSLDVWEDSN